MKLSNKGVTLYELLAYTAILGIVTVMLFTLVNLSMSRVVRIQQSNRMYVYANTILIDIKHENENINENNESLLTSDCSSAGFSKCIKIYNSSNTEYISIELSRINTNDASLTISSTNSGVHEYSSTTFTINFFESDILVDPDSCSNHICQSAIINISLSINFNNLKDKELFELAISI